MVLAIWQTIGENLTNGAGYMVDNWRESDQWETNAGYMTGDWRESDQQETDKELPIYQTMV